ncbi:MAG TPA: molybdopterin-dependent oxidoreductase, partial [Acidobacteriota bacterium]|nr:molybdopterin-dependent oxidoreductase [Acidobacteriota bacterium]
MERDLDKARPDALTRSAQPERSSLDRRAFLQVLGSGILISVSEPLIRAQGFAGSPVSRLSARLYINEDGSITALSGKVEEGQGPRTELAQAAAEELRVSISRIRMIMADTDLVPDDGITAGSRTTPVNVIQMRQAAATARELLTEHAAKVWQVDPASLEVRDGVITNSKTGQTMTYADLAKAKEVVAAFAQTVRPDVRVTAVTDWKVLGQPIPKLDARDIVTGKHRYPSDIVRPNMLYGRVLRAPAYGATLESIDLSVAQQMKDVVVVREGQFVAFAAPSSQRAEQAMAAASKSASWKLNAPSVSHRNVHAYLKEHANRSGARENVTGSVEEGFAQARKVLSETYTLAYIQHAPMEPRAAVAEWSDGRMTVWAGCDGPFRARRDVAQACGLPEEKVRVIIPDMGGGFGGKHSAEAAVEAARIAKAVGRPVSVRWTREEEFTWAYCRPAAVIECRAGLNDSNSIVAWDFTNINAGSAAISTPYEVPNVRTASVSSNSPVPQGSYRV